LQNPNSEVFYFMHFLPIILILSISCVRSVDKKTEPAQVENPVNLEHGTKQTKNPNPLKPILLTVVVNNKTEKKPSINNKLMKQKRISEKLDPPTFKEAKKLYPWGRTAVKYEPLSSRYQVPLGFARIPLKRDSWAWWLRHLPMRPKKSIPHDFKGRIIKDHSSYISGLVDLDVGKKDLQQCIDTIIRLRAEYLWISNRKSKIGFRFSGRRKFFWHQWSRGLRPKKVKGRLKFIKSRSSSNSKKHFYSYLNYIYMMTGTINHKGKKPVNPINLHPGNYFVTIHPQPIMGGAGHAVMVLDLAINKKNEQIALIAQGDIPAQDFHLVKNKDGALWFKLPKLDSKNIFLWPTPFYWKDLKSFKK
jgi:Domain of unknown function (4846)